MKYGKVLAAGLVTIGLAGFAQPGADIQSNVYQADQVNQAQAANIVNILAVLPAKVEVNDPGRREGAQIFGTLLGAAAGAALGSGIGNAAIGGAAAGGVAGLAAGSVVSGKTLVAGVSLTYTFNGHTLNSAQVGQMCQFKPGQAIMVSTGPTSTRIQPNATCPVKH